MLAAHSDHLRRLAGRINELESYPHPVIHWAEKAEWTVGGLRVHFEEWAKGQDPHPVPAQHVAKL